MLLPVPLQLLLLLKRHSAYFHYQLANFLLGGEYKEWVQNLQHEDLAWLVEYLDDVRNQIAFPHPSLSACHVGSRYTFSRRSCVPGIPK